MKYKIRTIDYFFKDAKKEYPSVHIDGRKRIHNPEMVYEIYKDFFANLVKEHFISIWLSASNKIIGFEVVSIGTLSSTLVHAPEVFRGAVISGASSIILAHNHPSGSLEPSQEDIRTTKKMAEAGKILDIPVFDHLIITYEGFKSFQQARLI